MKLRHRYWILLGLRWLPAGLMIPVFALLPLERGLTISQYATAAAVGGIFVLLFELPTGGFADTIGRKPVYVASAVVAMASFLVFATATSLTGFIVAAALQGIFRALDSGPLSAWFVDRVKDPLEVAKGLSRGAAVTSISIAAGALLSGGLIAINPFPSLIDLSLPVWVAVVAVAIQLISIFLLMEEQRSTDFSAALLSTKQMATTVKEGFALLGASRILAAMIVVEVFWVWGMVGFETFTPIRLSEILGGTSQSGAVMGPVTTVAWGLSGLAALLVPVLLDHYSKVAISISLKILQGLGLLAMALAGVPFWFIAAFLMTYAVHGPAGAVWEAIVHENVDNQHRATALSLGSMALQVSGAIAVVVLGIVADAAGTTFVFVIGGLSLFLAAPLYLVKNRHP